MVREDRPESINVLQSTHEEIVKRAVEVLRAGGLLIYPTETTYGAGVDATNDVAVRKLLQYKSRREGLPLSVAVSDRKMAENYVELNDVASNLYRDFLPGPLTVVSVGKHKVAPGVESEFGTLGIRIPDHPLIRAIVDAFGKPITATSANASYKPRPYSIDTMLTNLSQKQIALIDLILDSGELPHNPPSTVVDTTLNNTNVMRQGSIAFDTALDNSQVILEGKTDSEADTIRFGGLAMTKLQKNLAENPVIFAMRGELGAGKTQFAKGVAKQLGVEEQISSPTYTIIDEYDYRLSSVLQGKLVHADVWRVADMEELQRLGFKEYLTAPNVFVIEWADKFFDVLRDELATARVFLVDIDVIDRDVRHIRLSEFGDA